jgi:hypothetical protein
MDVTGKVAGIAQDFVTGKFSITFQVNESEILKNCYDQIKDVELLDIKAVKHREKRSLDANAYCWVIMSKIAQIYGTSKEEIYEIMLQRYGVLYESEEDGSPITITVKSSVDMSKISGHWFFLKGNDNFKAYAMIKGSSEYDTKEMSHFIDGVVSEAKEAGIETATPQELHEMKQRWNV